MMQHDDKDWVPGDVVIINDADTHSIFAVSEERVMFCNTRTGDLMDVPRKNLVKRKIERLSPPRSFAMSLFHKE